MIPALALAALGLARLSSAQSSQIPMERCGAPDPSRAQIEAAKILSEANNTELFRTETVTINTYFHIVATSKSEADGYLSVTLPPRSPSSRESELTPTPRTQPSSSSSRSSTTTTPARASTSNSSTRAAP